MHFSSFSPLSCWFQPTLRWSSPVVPWSGGNWCSHCSCCGNGDERNQGAWRNLGQGACIQTVWKLCTPTANRGVICLDLGTFLSPRVAWSDTRQSLGAIPCKAFSFPGGKTSCMAIYQRCISVTSGRGNVKLIVDAWHSSMPWHPSLVWLTWIFIWNMRKARVI